MPLKYLVSKYAKLDDCHAFSQTIIFSIICRKSFLIFFYADLSIQITSCDRVVNAFLLVHFSKLNLFGN